MARSEGRCTVYMPKMSTRAYGSTYRCIPANDTKESLFGHQIYFAAGGIELFQTDLRDFMTCFINWVCPCTKVS